MFFPFVDLNKNELKSKFCLSTKLEWEDEAKKLKQRGGGSFNKAGTFLCMTEILFAENLLFTGKSLFSLHLRYLSLKNYEGGSGWWCMVCLNGRRTE